MPGKERRKDRLIESLSGKNSGALASKEHRKDQLIESFGEKNSEGEKQKVIEKIKIRKLRLRIKIIQVTYIKGDQSLLDATSVCGSVHM